MRRLAFVLGCIVAALFGLLGVLLVVANTGPGRRGIESLASWGSGGTVRIIGLSGRFPDALQAKGLELRDKAGVYAVVRDASIDWSPMRLTGRTLAIDRLEVGDATILRLPEAGPKQAGSSSELPVRIELRAMRVGRLEVGQSVLGVDGSATLIGTETGQLHLAVRGLDDGATYSLDGNIGAGGIELHATVAEPAHGLLSRLADLPDLGAIALDANVNGPRSALVTRMRLDAGPLHASVVGAIDMPAGAADLTVEATAPAMRPAPDVAWQSVGLHARIAGKFTAPSATGQLRIDRLTAGAFSVDTIAAELSGDAGEATLRATLSGLHGQDPRADALMKSPVTLDATARLDAPDRPVRFTLHQDLLAIEGTATTLGQIRGHLDLTVPDLAPFGSVVGGDLRGRLAMKLDAGQVNNTTQLTIDGSMTALLGDAAKFHAAVILRGQAVALNDVRIDGHGIAVTGSGTLEPAGANLIGVAEIADLANIRPDLAGRLRVAASLRGPTDNLTAQADLTGSVAAAGVPSGPLTAHIDASGLPNAPRGSVTAHGELLGAPVTVTIAANSQGNAIHAVVNQVDWKSIHAEGDVRFDTASARAGGNMRLTVGRLADFTPLVGQPIAGDATVTLNLMDRQARIGLAVNNAGLPGSASVTRATLDASIDDPFGRPTVDATLALGELRAGGVAGTVSVKAHGPPNAVAVTVSGSVPNLAGAPLRLSLAGTIDAEAQQTVVASAEASWRQKTVRLLAPARFTHAGTVSVDRLRLGLDKAVLEASGQIAPALGLTSTLRGMPAALADMVVPDLGLEGSIDADVRLTGPVARPAGPIKVTATGLRLRQGFGRTLPPARIDATATLDGSAAQIDLRAALGTSQLTVSGRAPLGATGPLDLHAAGNLDMGILNPVLAANGRHIGGRLNMNAAIAGSAADPKLSGSADIVDGEIQDASQGARIHAIQARLELAGDTVRLVNAKGQADPGTVALGGTIGVLAPGMPIDLILTARNARPLATDALTVSLDADVTLRGPADAVTIGGTVRTRQIDIRVPEKLPSSVATIRVRDPARPPPAPPAPGPALALDLTLDVPNRAFVRGHGLDVELGGRFRLGGTLDRPRADGGLTLRQGTIAFAGQTLAFSKGTIGFNGASLSNPSIDLLSTTSRAAVTVTLTVSGTARAPKITLSSTPELPQDEMLAQLLFKRSVGSLSPFELAQIAGALASLTGVGPGIDSPLTRVRQMLGLDRLSVGTNARGGAALEAGRFVVPGVYVGAKQGASGGGQATVRIDIAKGLTVRGTTSTGGSATGAGGDTNGSSVGVGYEFEY
jgi:translocation and assembly module TamB